MPTSAPRLVSVLMPVYNEARTLRTIVGRVLASPIDLPIELVCVDDGSRDRSAEILEALAADEPRIRVIRQPRNQGKGAAIRTAIEHMRGDIGLIQDADLEYDPTDYPALIAPILEGKADAVFGSRFASASQRKVLLYWHGVANHFLTWLTNILNNINLTDMETCYKAVRADVLKQTPLKSDRFGIEPELSTRLAQWNIRIYEVPISYHGRTVAEGKKIGWKDAVSAVWTLLKYRFLDDRFTTHDGYYVLQSMRRAKGLNRWVLDQFRDVLGSRVLEAGCGIGNFTELLLDRERLVCLDNDPLYVEMLNWRLGHLENVTTSLFDLSDSAAYEPLKSRAHRHRLSASTCSSTSPKTSECLPRTTTCSNQEAMPSSSFRRTRPSSAPVTRRWVISGVTRPTTFGRSCNEQASRSSASTSSIASACRAGI